MQMAMRYKKKHLTSLKKEIKELQIRTTPATALSIRWAKVKKHYNTRISWDEREAATHRPLLELEVNL